VSDRDIGAAADGRTQVLHDLLSLVLDHETMGAALDRASVVIAGAIDGADEVSVTMGTEPPHTIAFSGDLALKADESQYEADAGPCLQAMRTDVVVRVDDLETDDRWPGYQPGGLAAGVRSSLSLPLHGGKRSIGALNIYSRKPAIFDANKTAGAMEVATYAGVVLANAELYYAASDRAEQMRQAMESRAVIEQAKGVLMAQQRCDAERAFFLLVRISQTTHRKLRDVAADLVAEAING
jgi:GAF domain-containing protein